MIDAPIHEDCIWEFQTKKDRILLITLVDGNLKEAQEFFKVGVHRWTYLINSLTSILINRPDPRWTRQRVSDSARRKPKDSRTFEKRFTGVRLHDPVDSQHPIHKGANFKSQIKNPKGKILSSYDII